MEHPNWIAERAKCDLDFLFVDIRRIVKLDVERMNADLVAREKTPGFAYLKAQADAVQFEVRTGDGGGTRFTYEEPKKRVMVLSLTGDFSVTTRWDPEQGRCMIVVTPIRNEKPSPVEFPHDQLWKAVQYLLEPLFFPSG